MMKILTSLGHFKAIKVASIILSIGLFSYLVGYFVVVNSGAFVEAQRYIIQSSKVKQEVGDNIEVKLSPMGYQLEFAGSWGESTLDCNVMGSRSKGSVRIILDKTDNIWRVRQATLKVNGKDLILQPAQDAIVIAPNENIYTYVRGNPISKIDPLGLIDLDIPGATGQNSIHGNPGPEATIPGSMSEHLPPHVHIGGNDGPRISSIDFQPLSPKDARNMTPSQKKFCERLSSEQKSLIKKRSKAAYKFGGFKKALSFAGIGITALTAETVREFLDDSLSDIVPGGVGDTY